MLVWINVFLLYINLFSDKILIFLEIMSRKGGKKVIVFKNINILFENRFVCSRNVFI